MKKLSLLLVSCMSLVASVVSEDKPGRTVAQVNEQIEKITEPTEQKAQDQTQPTHTIESDIKQTLDMPEPKTEPIIPVVNPEVGTNETSKITEKLEITPAPQDTGKPVITEEKQLETPSTITESQSGAEQKPETNTVAEPVEKIESTEASTQTDFVQTPQDSVIENNNVPVTEPKLDIVQNEPTTSVESDINKQVKEPVDVEKQTEPVKTTEPGTQPSEELPKLEGNTVPVDGNEKQTVFSFETIQKFCAEHNREILVGVAAIVVIGGVLYVLHKNGTLTKLSTWIKENPKKVVGALLLAVVAGVAVQQNVGDVQTKLASLLS